jgi:hypothetical protein
VNGLLRPASTQPFPGSRPGAFENRAAPTNLVPALWGLPLAINQGKWRFRLLFDQPAWRSQGCVENQHASIDDRGGNGQLLAALQRRLALRGRWNRDSSMQYRVQIIDGGEVSKEESAAAGSPENAALQVSGSALLRATSKSRASCAPRCIGRWTRPCPSFASTSRLNDGAASKPVLVSFFVAGQSNGDVLDPYLGPQTSQVEHSHICDTV